MGSSPASSIGMVQALDSSRPIVISIGFWEMEAVVNSWASGGDACWECSNSNTDRGRQRVAPAANQH